MGMLSREILLALLFKAAALFALYVLFFSPAHRPTVTPVDMTTALSQQRIPSR